MLLLAVDVIAQEPPPNAKWRLTTIVFEGLKSQPPEKMIDASGLKVGQTIDFEMVKAAAQRLSQTGLFGKVAYSYRYSSTQIELTFELEEKATGKKRCSFDNFVWFSDREIADAIRRDMPDFDGNILISDFASEEIKKSLTRLLAEKKVAGEVVYELFRVEEKTGEDLTYMFKVKGANLPICDIQFAGAQDELKKPLLDALKPLFKTEYSKSDVGSFANAALLPIYTQRGYLKAEGPQYRMGQVTIAGLPEDDARRVKDAWGLKAGEIFNNSYTNAFLAKVMRDGLIKLPQGVRTVQELKRDEQRLTVDLVVKFDRKP